MTLMLIWIYCSLMHTLFMRVGLHGSYTTEMFHYYWKNSLYFFILFLVVRLVINIYIQSLFNVSVFDLIWNAEIAKLNLKNFSFYFISLSFTLFVMWNGWWFFGYMDFYFTLTHSQTIIVLEHQFALMVIYG